MRRDPAAGPAVPRAIRGFHLDDEGHWVAELDCGHTQHVRHDPPWQNRPWVTTAGGRASRLGTTLACVACVAEAGAAAGRAMDSLRRIVRALRASSTTTERELGLPSAQLFALRQVSLHPGDSLSDLSARTRTTQSAVSEVVGRLVERGLVERRTARDDRRRARLMPTAAGRLLLSRAPDTAQERLVAGFAMLEVKEQAALVHALEAWLRVARLDAVPPTMFFEPESSASGESPQ
jgi:DNA-binding MarR family transcriptional regulator